MSCCGPRGCGPCEPRRSITKKVAAKPKSTAKKPAAKKTAPRKSSGVCGSCGCSKPPPKKRLLRTSTRCDYSSSSSSSYSDSYDTYDSTDSYDSYTSSSSDDCRKSKGSCYRRR